MSFLTKLKARQWVQSSLIKGNTYRGGIRKSMVPAVSNTENFQLNTFNKLALFLDDCYTVLRSCQSRYEGLLLTLNSINPSMQFSSLWNKLRTKCHF